MSAKETRIRALIEAILAFMEQPDRRLVHGAEAGLEAALNRARAMDFDAADAFTDLPPQPTRHDATLQTALAAMEADKLGDIAACLRNAKDDLVWAEDDGKYYPPGADLGPGYKACNLHSLLIGPGACGFEHADFSLGIFMLGPKTLYRDHRHLAPEVYLNLSPLSGWRFNSGDWQDHPTGTLLHNAPKEVHATRSYDLPFLSVFSWVKDLHGACEVVDVGDWDHAESGLRLS